MTTYPKGTWPFEIDEVVCIIGWPPAMHDKMLRAVVTDVYGVGDDAKVIVRLITGTDHFLAGEIHEFPALMLIHPEAHQERLV